MPNNKHNVRPNSQRAAIGLSNHSEYSQEVNEEAARIEAVEKINGLSHDYVIEDDFLKVGGIRVEVGIERLNVRESMDVNSRLLFVAMKGDIFLTDTLNGEWLLIQAPEGSPTWGKGYVVAKFMKEVNYG